MYLQTAFYLKVRLDGIMCCHIGADIGQCALVRIVHGRFWGFYFFLCFFFSFVVVFFVEALDTDVVSLARYGSSWGILEPSSEMVVLVS